MYVCMYHNMQNNTVTTATAAVQTVVTTISHSVPCLGCAVKKVCFH